MRCGIKKRVGCILRFLDLLFFRYHQQTQRLIAEHPIWSGFKNAHMDSMRALSFLVGCERQIDGHYHLLQVKMAHTLPMWHTLHIENTCQVCQSTVGNRCGNWGQRELGKGRRGSRGGVFPSLITKCTHDNPICPPATQRGKCTLGLYCTWWHILQKREM